MMRHKSCNRRSRDHPRLCVFSLFVATILFLDFAQIAFSFSHTAVWSPTRNPTRLAATSSGKSYDPDEEVKKRLARAKEVLAKSKAKMESKQNDQEEQEGKEAGAVLPFFASKKPRSDPKRREQLSKAINKKTGLVHADGDKMAAMSEQEEWESRSLLEVFENQIKENADVYSEASKQLAERDVAASIWNLRKTMQTEDYQRIFDKRNRFIGEDM